MHRCLEILVLTAMAALSCDRTPLSARDVAGVDAAADAGQVVGQVIVMKEGAGSGTVTSSPGGITCGGTCVADFASPALVTLSAVPDSISSFVGWSGECQGIGPCTIQVNTTHAVTARFAAQEHRLEVGRQGFGRGRVTSFPAMIDCGPTCAANVETGLTLIFSAMADADSIFVGWSGDCHGSGACTLVLDGDRMAMAHFEPATQGLHVSRSGTGTGRVSSSPSGIDCGDLCTASFAPGNDIVLQAWPDTTSTFAGWTGLCQGTETCALRLNAAGSVTANFELIQYGLSIDKTGSGSGTVTATPAGLASSHSCAATYPAGTLVTLTATPDETSVFTGWEGACSGAGICVVTMDGSPNVSAHFESIRRRLSVNKTGEGEITSIPSGIRCGAVCDEDFVIGTHVLLQARPGPGATFVGWSGVCTGTAPCTVILDTDRSVTASFR